MSEYELIPEEAYENLPQDSHDKFAVLVRIAQANLARLLDGPGSPESGNELRAQFISIISGAAEVLGIQGLPEIGNDITTYAVYTNFLARLARVVTQVRLQSSLVARPHSVALGRITRARIRQEVDQLRRSVANSDLERKKRQALLDKLDEFETELEKQRLSFARTMAIAASIMTVVGGGAATLADAPEAVLTIIRLVGEDKEKEEAERERLMPPPKSLPDFSKTPSASPVLAASDDDLSDDVPF